LECWVQNRRLVLGIRGRAAGLYDYSKTGSILHSNGGQHWIVLVLDDQARKEMIPYAQGEDSCRELFVAL
jgi:hypothetical protein